MKARSAALLLLLTLVLALGWLLLSSGTRSQASSPAPKLRPSPAKLRPDTNEGPPVEANGQEAAGPSTPPGNEDMGSQLERDAHLPDDSGTDPGDSGSGSGSTGRQGPDLR